LSGVGPDLLGAGRGLEDPAEARASILDLVGDRLRQVEELFRRNLASPAGLVGEMGSFVAEGGGKRVRPMLHLLCARLCAYEGPHDVLLATVLEFIHSATLIHDDVIDAAPVRRGRPALHERWGNNVTVLFGDYLYAKAMAMALEAGSLEVMEKLAEITLDMTEGEMLQTRYVGRLDLTVPEYFELIDRKTARLFAGCCELAGILAGAGARQRLALRRYGRNLGLAFQIVDDLLDFVGEESRLGKPAASDLREGKATLPLIELLTTDGDRAHEIAGRISKGEATGADLAALEELLRSSGAIARTQKEARRLAALARAELAGFPPSRARRALEDLPLLLVARDH
jgi:octaprenyl-diphosphate synthase